MSNLPQITGQSFGIRASDRSTGIGNEGNDVIQLALVTEYVDALGQPAKDSRSWNASHESLIRVTASLRQPVTAFESA